MKKLIIFIVLAFALVLQGCSSGEKSNQVSGNNKELTKAPTAAPSVVATVTIAPEAKLVLPLTVNDTGKVLIQTVSRNLTYPYNSYIITSVNGESIVVDPTVMPDKSFVDINPVAIISTHSHPDHVDSTYIDSYDVEKMIETEGEIKTKDFKICSIKSSHTSDKIIGTNYIMLIEVDGLRIAHMGDIGQTTLTKDQLEQLGTIDIAFMQFDNSYSLMSATNEKGFKLMEQLNPKIIITTHTSDAADAKLKDKYGTITEVENLFAISKDELPDTFLNTYKILNNHVYK